MARSEVAKLLPQASLPCMSSGAEDTRIIWFNVTWKVYGSGGEERRRRVMKDRVIPALQAAGIQGTVSEDGLTFRVEE